MSVNEEKTKLSPEEKEELEFRSFARRLLDAQKYEFFDEHIFSLKTLRKTFTAFCDIIAAELGTESCTIHLQLYDAESIHPAHLEKEVEMHLDDIIRRYGFSDESEKNFRRSREPLLRSSRTFPYWRYPKGASVLFASNSKGPWAKLTHLKEHGIAPLEKGISKDIYQENIARVRDPLTIQSTRSFQKLGGADPYVWTNSCWEEVFRNFYGVPIRIHSLGEATGILKVENKKQSFGSQDALQAMLSARNLEALESAYVGYLAGGHLDGLHASLLAFVYLAADLGSVECRALVETDMTYGGLIFLPFPHIPYEDSSIRLKDGDQVELHPDAAGKYDELHYQQLDRETKLDRGKSGLYSSLNPRGARPPVQLFAESIVEERKLWAFLLTNEADGPVNEERLRRLISGLRSFYEEASKALTEPETLKVLKSKDQEWSSDEIEFDEIHFEVKLDLLRSKDLLPFYRALTVRRVGNPEKDVKRDQDHVKMLVMIPPTLTELESLDEDWKRGNRCWTGQWTWNALRQDLKSSGLGPLYRGERVQQQNSEKWVTDLAIDRLAARSQAFVRALTVVEFSEADTRKLSWAALEIGKVLEREIAYRANYSEDPIPLTAMEFYRIPISYLGFVDDLRQRRRRSEVVEEDTKRRIEQIVERFGWQQSMRVDSRVKEYRSFLARLGERYEGFIRGNIAMGLFLLSIRLAKDGCSAVGLSDKESKEIENFQSRLWELNGRIRQILEDKELASSLNDEEKESLKSPETSRFLGDFRFRAAPFTWSKDKCDTALERLLKTLIREKLLQREGEGEGSSGTSRAPGVADLEAEIRNYKTVLQNLRAGASDSRSEDSSQVDDEQKALQDLLFRRYDSFAQSAYSLLCQLANVLYGKPGEEEQYRAFYRTCYWLRSQLSGSVREIHQDEKSSAIRRVFEGKVWQDVLDFVDQHDTRAFVRMGGHREASVLLLNARGIYKRVRMMHNVLRKQISASSLEWELGKMDLVGVRGVGLFKHQVFALSEYAWSRGDSFFDFDLEARNSGEYVRRDQDATSPPWLVLRTKTFEGSYHAVQIAGLVDPSTVGEEFVRPRVYSPRRLRKFLGRTFRDLERERWVEYQNYSFHRNRSRLALLERTDDAPQVAVSERRLATAFLFEGVIEVLLLILNLRLEHDSDLKEIAEKKGLSPILGDVLRDHPKSRERVRNLLSALGDVLRYGSQYTEKFRDVLIRDERAAWPDFDCGSADSESEICRNCKSGGTWQGKGAGWSRPGTCQIYERAVELLEAIADSETRNDLTVVSEYLEKEKAFFETCGQDVSAPARARPVGPLFFVDPETARSEAGELGREDLRKRTRAVEILRGIQQQYSSWFFDRGEEGTGGLWLRDAREVLGRIENYVLLFSRESLEKSDREKFAGWTAYDLFHYLRGLIPVEIQVRTQLANTVAEQYHDRLYKGRPGMASRLARPRVEELAKELETWDLEMDRVYQGFLRQAQWPDTPEDASSVGNGDRAKDHKTSGSTEKGDS